MLPFFTTLPSGPLEELQRGLQTLVAAHFPMQSDEFPRGSLQCNNYMDCVRKVKECKRLPGMCQKLLFIYRHIKEFIFSVILKEK